MSNLDEDEENLAHFLESEILSEVSDQDDDAKDIVERPTKRKRAEHQFRYVKSDVKEVDLETVLNSKCSSCINEANLMDGVTIESGILSKIPPELFSHILKFLSSEDLISCTQVCKFLSYAASDESLWRRLYCLRWGLLQQKKLRDCAWKKLYIQRDEEDMVQSVMNTAETLGTARVRSPQVPARLYLNENAVSSCCPEFPKKSLVDNNRHNTNMFPRRKSPRESSSVEKSRFRNSQKMSA